MKYLFAFLFVLAGCQPKQPVGPPPLATQYYEYTQELPKNAQIVEDLGNGWIVYKVEVMGEIRWFKQRYTGDFSGEAQTLAQTVTELRPPASYYNNVLK